MEAYSRNEEVLTGNDRYEGYSIDIIKEIANLLAFKYVIKLVDDGAYGRKNEEGEWNGMIKELIEGVSVYNFVSQLLMQFFF